MQEVENQAMDGFLRSGIDYETVGKAFSEFFEREYSVIQGSIIGDSRYLNRLETELLQECLKKFDEDYRSFLGML
jgi:hypothetical protein